MLFRPLSVGAFTVNTQKVGRLAYSYTYSFILQYKNNKVPLINERRKGGAKGTASLSGAFSPPVSSQYTHVYNRDISHVIGHTCCTPCFVILANVYDTSKVQYLKSNMLQNIIIFIRTLDLAFKVQNTLMKVCSQS